MTLGRLWRRLSLFGLVAVMAAVALSPVAARPQRPAAGVQLVRFGGGHFSSGRGFGFASRPRTVSRFGRTSGRSRGILRSIGHALAFAAVFHFLFAGSHGGGFLLLIIIVGLIVVMMRRRRRQRVYARW
jgi:hypothetical protein